MPKNYRIIAMGINDKLKQMKRNMTNYVDSVYPVRKIVVTGSGAQRRLTDAERPIEGSGSVVITQNKRQLRPLNFKF
jgi:hypothetical protein